MSINLASSLSAITTDPTTGVSHLVWADNGRIWHAYYDNNSETWVEAETIAFIGTAPINNLNLVANTNLIDGENPGLVVVWQQGSLNRSDFYYTAAQYDENLDLQWLPSPQALTSDQVGDLEPTVTVFNSNSANQTSVVVVGSKVNLENAAKQSIREDTDFYSQTFSISSSQFAVSTDDPTPAANYEPQISKNGVVNLGVLANNTQATIQTAQATTTVGSPNTLTTSSQTEQPGQLPVGAFNAQTYFNSNLLEDWELMESVPADGFLRSIIEPVMRRLELVGTLSGGTTFAIDEEQLLFIKLNSQAEWKTAYRPQTPWSVTQNNSTNSSIISNRVQVGAGQRFRGKVASPIKIGFDLDSVYQFSPSSPYYLDNIDDVLGFTASITLPLVPSIDTAGFFSSDINGSIGLNFNLLASPSSTGGSYSPQTITALAATVAGQSLAEVGILAKAIASGGSSGLNALVAEIAVNVGETIAAYINGAAEGLDMAGSISFPVFATGVEGKLKIPHVPILSAQLNGGIRTAFNWGIGDTDNSINLTFPVGVEFRVGPLGFGFNFNPGWTWDVFDGNKTQAGSASASPVEESAALSAVEVSSSTATASVSGSLVTVDFGTTISTLPIASDFTFTVTDPSSQQRVIPIFNILPGPSSSSTVVLQLDSAVPNSENYNYTTTDNPEPTKDTFSLSFTNSEGVQDASGNELQGFSQTNVTNNTPNSFAYNFNPISGNSQNYVIPTLFLAFATPLATNTNPSTSLFSVSAGTNTLAVANANIVTDGVFLTFDSTVTNTSLQNVTIKYTSSNSGIKDTSGQPIGSFTIQNGISAQVSQNYINIANTNSSINLSSTASDYTVQKTSSGGQPTTVGIQQVVLSNGNALLSLASSIAPSDTVTITYNSYGISPLVTAIAPPTITTQALESTIEADLGQDSSPVLIQPGSSNPILAWVSDAPLLVPVAGVVNGAVIYLNFIADLGNGTNTYPEVSQFSVTDQNKVSYAVNNMSINDNTLTLSLDTAVDSSATITVAYELVNSSPIGTTSENLYLTNNAANNPINLYVSPFSNFGLTNITSPSTPPSTPPPVTVLGAASSVATATSNLIVLAFNTTLSYNGGKNDEFVVVKNGEQFSVSNVTVAENSVLLTVSPPANVNLIGSGDYVTVSYSGTSLTGPNSQSIGFNNQIVTTTPANPTTLIKTSILDPGAQNLAGTITSIPNTVGLNFSPVGAYISMNNDEKTPQAVALIWTNVTALPDTPAPSLVPGEFYTTDQTTLINNSFNSSNIYYSLYDFSTSSWTLAAPLANQAGSEDALAIAAIDDGEFMAAWINYSLDPYTNEYVSTIYSSTLTYNTTTQSWPAWSTPTAVSTTANPDPLTDLRIVLIDGTPTVLWTQTQAPSYSELTQNESPLLYYRLAELSGPTLINQGVYGAGGNGSYKGTVLFHQVGALETPYTGKGDPNPAVLFAAASSAVSSIIPLSGNNFSIEFWFQVSALPAPSEPLNLVSVTGLIDIGLTNTGLNLNVNGINYNSSGFAPTVNEWTYVVATYDGVNQNASLYINGQLSSKLSSLAISIPSTTTVTLASINNTDSVYLDEVALYRTAIPYNEIPDIKKFASLTPSQISQLLFESNPIGNKFKSQYVPPLPPGPNTNYVSLEDKSWTKPNTIIPLAKPVATQLSDASKPEWDITSFTAAASSGSVYPNGFPDLFLALSLSNQQTGIGITSIVVSVDISPTETITWSVGTNSASGYQLAVVQGNRLLNSLNPYSDQKFAYTILSPEVSLQLFLDPGTHTFNNTTTFLVTTTFGNGQTNTQSLRPTDPTSEPTSINTAQVSGTATVTEANDSSLALIDSGFIINTNNVNIGYAIVSADFNGDQKSDVAVANRGYKSSSGSAGTGTIQVLFGGGDVLSDGETNPLTTTDLSGNPNGILITGIQDSGQANGDFPMSLATGDINGDGIDDLVIGDPNADSVYVIYISKFTGGQTIDVTNLSSDQGYTISGTQGSSFGFSVAVGNFNSPATRAGGPYAAGTLFDVVIGAPGENSGNGATYIAFDGSAKASPIYTSTNPGELAGFSVAVSSLQPAGTTFTGNQYSDDLIIGASGYTGTVTNQWAGLNGLPATANPNGGAYPATSSSELGAVYVWQSNGTENLDSYASYVGPNLPSSNGTANNINLGSALYSGDLNGDGINDLAIAAPGDSDNSGVVYVLAGSVSTDSSAQNILNVANLAIVGGLPLSQTGTVVTSPGDLNDDRYQDLLITAPSGANGTGQSYVIFGPLDLEGVGTVLDLNVTANASQGTFLLNGNQPYQLSGVAGGGIGDINFDGVDDLMITAPNAGQLYAVYGHPWLTDDGSIKLANISGDNGFVVDGNLYSVNGVALVNTGYNVVLLGDVNGDGFDDLMSAGSANGAILTFGASTADLLDAATGSNQLLVSISGTNSLKKTTKVGDFNGDGLADFGVIDTLNNFYLILGNEDLSSKGTLVLDSASATAINITEATLVGDYNGDGFDDLVLSTTTQTSTLILGNRLGTLNRSPLFSGNNNTFGSLGDINGDGFGDFAGSAPAGNGIANIYLGNQDAGSSSPLSLSPPTAAFSLPVPTAQNTWNTSVYDNQSTKFNAAPSLAVFNGVLYMAYTGVKDSNENGSPFVQWSTDGVTWNGNTNFQNPLGQASTGTSIAVFDGKLYAAWLNTDQELIIASAISVPISVNPSGLQWSPTINTGYKASYVSPALSVLDGVLYVFFASGGQNESIFEYVSSQDGITWTLSPSSLPLPYGFLPLGSGFAVTSDESNLYLNYAQATGNNTASAKDQILATFDGSNWSFDSFGPAPLYGSGLINLAGTLQNFYSPFENEINTMSLGPNSGWSSPSTLYDISNDTKGSVFTYVNSAVFQERLFVSYGNSLSGNYNSSVAYANTVQPIVEANQTQQFGQDFVNIGDFNGDGIADFGVLAPGFFSNLGVINNNTLENNQGAVLIYYGTASGLPAAMNPDLVLGTPMATAATNVANHQALLLSQVAPAGDLNGDGYDDVVIASPTTALTNQNTTDGVAFVVFGGGDNLWGTNYPATSPFNLGNLSSRSSSITLSFSSALNQTIIPAAGAFTVTGDPTPVAVASVIFNSAYEITLNLTEAVETNAFLTVSYQLPSSGAVLTYASGTKVSSFTASNDPSLSTLGAPIIGPLDSYAQYGFTIAGLPESLAGVSLDGGGDVNGDGFSDFLIGAPGVTGSNINLSYTLFGSDFNNTVNQVGTIGNDVMVGTPTGESFVAGQGNDIIYTDGGNDIVYAGPGDDYVTVNDTYFQRLDGGSGLDVLALQGYKGQDWDLTTLSPGMRLRNFEILVTEGYGANMLNLNTVSVNALSSTNTLTVIMDDQDTLVLNDDFSFTGYTYQYNQNFNVYQSASTAATILVNRSPKSVFIDTTAPNINYPATILPAATINTNRAALESVVSASTRLQQSSMTVNDQPGSGVSTQIYVSNPTITEKAGRADFTVSRTGDLNQYVWVDYYTKDGDGKAGDRYIPVAGQLVFAPGESSKTVTVPIPNNGKYVGNRQFSLAVSLEGETTDPSLVPDAWQAAMTTPKEQVRRWTLNSESETASSISFNVTSSQSANHIVTLDLDLNGTVRPQVWNPSTQAFQALPFDPTNGLVQFLDINGDMTHDLYRMKFQDGGPFDGDRLLNGLVNLTFDLAQLKPTTVPADGGRTQGTDGNDYINAASSTGTNRLEGLEGNDVLIGSPQRDILIGGVGNDNLFGGAGVDQLYGDAGDDILDGGSAMNFLYGGVGADHFVLRASNGPQRVMDFNPTAGDQFLLDNLTFTQLSFQGNQIKLGLESLALVVDYSGQPVTTFATNPGWFSVIQSG